MQAMGVAGYEITQKHGFGAQPGLMCSTTPSTRTPSAARRRAASASRDWIASRSPP